MERKGISLVIGDGVPGLIYCRFVRHKVADQDVTTPRWMLRARVGIAIAITP